MCFEVRRFDLIAVFMGRGCVAERVGSYFGEGGLHYESDIFISDGSLQLSLRVLFQFLQLPSPVVAVPIENVYHYLNLSILKSRLHFFDKIMYAIDEHHYIL